MLEKTLPYDGPVIRAGKYNFVRTPHFSETGEVLWAIHGGRMITFVDIAEMCKNNGWKPPKLEGEIK